MYQKKTSMIYRPGRRTACLRLSSCLLDAMRTLGVDLNTLVEKAMLKEFKDRARFKKMRK